MVRRSAPATAWSAPAGLPDRRRVVRWCLNRNQAASHVPMELAAAAQSATPHRPSPRSPARPLRCARGGEGGHRVGSIGITGNGPAGAGAERIPARRPASPRSGGDAAGGQAAAVTPPVRPDVKHDAGADPRASRHCSAEGRVACAIQDRCQGAAKAARPESSPSRAEIRAQGPPPSGNRSRKARVRVAPNPAGARPIRRTDVLAKLIDRANSPAAPSRRRPTRAATPAVRVDRTFLCRSARVQQRAARAQRSDRAVRPACGPTRRLSDAQGIGYASAWSFHHAPDAERAQQEPEARRGTAAIIALWRLSE